jgi:hypothetical protein
MVGGPPSSDSADHATVLATTRLLPAPLGTAHRAAEDSAPEGTVSAHGGVARKAG